MTVYLLTSPTSPNLYLQPTGMKLTRSSVNIIEIASAHWVKLSSLMDPTYRTYERVDVSSRVTRRGGRLVRAILPYLLGKMRFAAVRLEPIENIPAGWQSKSNQPLLLWGLTLGCITDFVMVMPPHTSRQIWTFPTFDAPDVRVILWLFSFVSRRSAKTVAMGPYLRYML